MHGVVDHPPEPQHQRETQHEVELVNVSQRREHPVEQVLHTRRTPPLHGSEMAGTDHEHPEQHAQREEAAVRVAAMEKADEPEQQHNAAVDRQVEQPDQVVARARARIEVGTQSEVPSSVRGARSGTSCSWRTRSSPGTAGCSGRAPARAPATTGASPVKGATRPSGATPGTRAPGQHPDHPERDHRRHRDRVDPPTVPPRRLQRRRTPDRPRSGRHQRHQDPRRQGHRPGLDGDRAEGGDPGRQHVREPASTSARSERDPRPGRTGRSRGTPDRAAGEPQPLHRPGRQVRQLAQQKNGPIGNR